MKCIICGRKEGDIYTWHENEFTISLKEYQLPHGSIPVCKSIGYGDECMKHLTLQLNDFASPLIWMSLSDLYEEDNIETLSKEEADNITAEEFLGIAETASDIIWVGDAHRDACDDAVEVWREQKEKEMIENMPRKELPLLIGALKYKKNKDLLVTLLKGD